MKLVFIVGTGRCGSTLVHEVMAKHEGFGFISNIEDRFHRINKYGKYNNFLYGSSLGNYTAKGGLRFAPSEGYRLISREVSPIYQNSSRDLLESDVTPWLESRFRRFFEDRNKQQKKPVFTHKYTGWSRIDFFKKIFPEAKFIHIVRDGRAVANSWLQMPWWGGYRGPENWLWGELSDNYRDMWKRNNNCYVTLAGISWRVLMDSFLESEKKINSKDYLRIRYEDILDDPEEKFKKIIDFCEMEWTPEFNKKFSAWKFTNGRKNAFENDLNNGQLKLLNVCLEDMLEQYGYL